MIAKSYAEILFEIAMKNNAVEDINKQFELLMTIVDDYQDWLTILDTPTLSITRKIILIKELKVFDGMFIRFLSTLIRNNQVRLLDLIYEEWLVKSRFEQKIAYIQLYSAKKLTKKQLTVIQEDIQPLFPDLAIEFNVHIDPSLIRGVRLYYQGESIERSIKRELADLRSSI